MPPTEATHLLYVDNDIEFTAEKIARFISSGYDVVSAACPKKGWHFERLKDAVGPSGYTTKKRTANGPRRTVAEFSTMGLVDHNYMPLPDDRPEVKEIYRLPPGYFKAYNEPTKENFLPILRAGTGFLMLSGKALDTVVGSNVHYVHDRFGLLSGVFQQDIVRGSSALGAHGEWVGEDYVLCDRLRKAGYDIMLDTEPHAGLTHTGVMSVNGKYWWVPIQSGFPVYAKEGSAPDDDTTQR